MQSRQFQHQTLTSARVQCTLTKEEAFGKQAERIRQAGVQEISSLWSMHPPIILDILQIWISSRYRLRICLELDAVRPRPGSRPVNTQLCVYLRKNLVASNSLLLPLRHFSSCFQFSPVRIPLLYAKFHRYMQPHCTLSEISAFDEKLEQFSCPGCYLSNFSPKQAKIQFPKKGRRESETLQPWVVSPCRLTECLKLGRLLWMNWHVVHALEQEMISQFAWRELE